jgi:hypothetical protein
MEIVTSGWKQATLLREAALGNASRTVATSARRTAISEVGAKERSTGSNPILRYAQYVGDGLTIELPYARKTHGTT